MHPSTALVLPSTPLVSTTLVAPRSLGRARALARRCPAPRVPTRQHPAGGRAAKVRDHTQHCQTAKPNGEHDSEILSCNIEEAWNNLKVGVPSVL